MATTVTHAYSDGPIEIPLNRGGGEVIRIVSERRPDHRVDGLAEDVKLLNETVHALMTRALVAPVAAGPAPAVGGPGCAKRLRGGAVLLVSPEPGEFLMLVDSARLGHDQDKAEALVEQLAAHFDTPIGQAELRSCGDVRSLRLASF